MKNSLKLMMVALLGFLLAGQANAEREEAGQSFLRANIDTLHPYIPSDLDTKGAIKNGMSFDCNKNGDEVRSSPEVCFTYYSNSQNSRWVIRYSDINPDKNKMRVFQVLGGQNQLWVAFDNEGSTTATYTSNEAQKFASSNGNSSSDMAQSPNGQGNNANAKVQQSSKENCANKNLFQQAGCNLNNSGINPVGVLRNIFK